MKILHVITSLRTGGAEKLMVDLLPRIKDLGNEVELLVFDGTKTPFYCELERKGITIHSFWEKDNIYNLLNIIKLIPFLKKYDVIHTHNTAAQFFTAIAAFLIPQNKAKLYTTEHNTTNRRRTIFGFKYIDKLMYKQYDHIICISNATKDNLCEYLNLKTNNIHVIYNGINLIEYQQATPLNRLDITNHPERTIITMIAGFRKQKDHKTLIETMMLIPNNYELWLIGDGDLRTQYENLVKERNLTNRVHFLGIRTDVKNLLKTVDIVVISSHWEGFGLAAAEAMAAGIPVIASNVSGLNEIIQNSGLLFPQGDANTLAKLIIEIAENRILKEEIVKLGLERSIDFDISTMALNYSSLYH